MKKVKGKTAEKGNDSLSYYHYRKFDKRYDELIGQVRKENALPETAEKKRGRKKKGKILAPCGVSCELQGISPPFYP